MLERVYDLYSADFKKNAHKTYATMRQAGRICYHPGMDDDFNVWFVTGYEDVEMVLRDHQRFVKDYRHVATPEQLAKWQEPDELFSRLDDHMLNMDPPDHTRLRALVSKVFTARQINKLQPRVQEMADALIDKVIDQGEMDLIDDYAFPLPITVISEMLGIPTSERDNFRRWSEAFINQTTATENRSEFISLMTEFVQYLGQIIAQRREQPQDDLISDLIKAEEAGDKLSEEELYSMIVLLIVAGHETTTNLIGNGILGLLEHPDQLALLRAEPARIDDAIEEILRYDGPAERATMRWAAEDMTIGDQTIERGQPVVVSLASANRDEKRFQRPDVLDITREDKRNLGFGFGIHYCVGAALARMEGKIAINTLIQRLPELRLRESTDTLSWRVSNLIRGMEHMPVVW